MATLKDIRKRINSVKSTEQITKAMKMVSSAKLMRAQAKLMDARPYREAMEDVVSRLFATETVTHPLTKARGDSSSSRQARMNSVSSTASCTQTAAWRFCCAFASGLISYLGPNETGMPNTAGSITE